jgi:nucleoside-diphosphate kinase
MCEETTLILIKPKFTKASIIIQVQKALNDAGLITVNNGFSKFSKDDAKNFYINKKETNFYNELTDYISSGSVYGFVVKGEDAITKVKNIANLLRQKLPIMYDLETDVMRNVLHASCKAEGEDKIQLEIKIFLKNKQ